MEFYIRNNKLISEKEWKKEIDSLKTNVLIKDKKKIIEITEETFINAVKKRAENCKNIGLLFSGGLDSSFIAAILKKLGFDFTAYCVGFEDKYTKSEDLKYAKEVADFLKIRLKTRVYNLKEAEIIIKKTVSVLGNELNNVVNVGIGSVVVACNELGKKNNITDFFSGLGSEEIFAGYQRHKEAKDYNKECWRGLNNMWERDLLRDTRTSEKLNFKLHTPFLDTEMIKKAMQIPSEYKIKEGKTKVILRQTAEKYLKEYSKRKKKAAQYGSRFDKAIERLKKQNNFKYKKEYIHSIQ